MTGRFTKGSCRECFKKYTSVVTTKDRLETPYALQSPCR